MPSRYDTIVIGSGAGGLAAAVALAQAGQKVLVCEQHDVPGGWLHSFTLDGFRFNTGVHYIGELGKGERLRQIYEGLGISKDISFLELNPDAYDHIFLGDERFDIPKGRDAYVARLKKRFPDDAAGIDRLFDRIADIYWTLVKIVDEDWISIGKRPASLPWLVRSGASLVNRHVKDPLLRAILVSQSGMHGMPPSQVSAAVHAAIIQHMMEGCYHPKGGGMAIARAFVRALNRAGGEIRLQTPVERILLDGRKVLGVELADGEILYADHVISNTDPHGTFDKLIGRQQLSGRLRRKLDRVGYSTSCLSLYLTLDCDLKSMGFDSGNFWLFDTADVDGILRQGLTGFNAEHTPQSLFVTATTLKDPGKMVRGCHQLEVFTFVDYEPFVRWAGQPSGKRDADYTELKEQISTRMLNALERYWPGLKDAVVFRDLGTPLTNYHYIRSFQGNIYGIDKGISQAGPRGFRATTEFKGLYLCGASTMAHGIAYATNTGLTAAGKILGCRAWDLLRQEGPELKIYQSESVELPSYASS